MTATKNNQSGVTIIELMIVIGISSIIMLSVVSAMHLQQKTHTSQQQIIEMQQNLRASMYLMSTEIRMAGYVGFDTTTFSKGTSGAGITAAGPNTFTFSMDLNADGDTSDTGEQITYSLSGTELRRGADTMGYDIESVGFGYAFDDTIDGDTNLETINTGNIIWAVDTNADGILDKRLDTNNNGTVDVGDTDNDGVALANDDQGEAITNVSIARIRAVRVWILARTRAPIREYSNTDSYKVGMYEVNGGGDSFKRNLLSTTIRCRNMGL